MNTLAPPQHPSRKPSGPSSQSSNSPKDSYKSSVCASASSPAVSPKAPRLPARSPLASPSASLQLTSPAVPNAQSQSPVILNTPLQSTPPDELDALPPSPPIAALPPQHLDQHPVTSTAPQSPTSAASNSPPQFPSSSALPPEHHIPPLLPPPQRLQDLDESLSEAQLRQLYENEEIERFFSLFKAVSLSLISMCSCLTGLVACFGGKIAWCTRQRSNRPRGAAIRGDCTRRCPWH